MGRWGRGHQPSPREPRWAAASVIHYQSISAQTSSSEAGVVFSLGKPWSQPSLSAQGEGPWQRGERSGVRPRDPPRAQEQNGLWPVPQKGSPAVSHGIMCKFAINILTKENIRTIDYLLITVLLRVLYLWKGTGRRLLLFL